MIPVWNTLKVGTAGSRILGPSAQLLHPLSSNPYGKHCCKGIQIDVDILDMANTIMNNVEVAAMNAMVSKLDLQDITGIKDMATVVDMGNI